MNNNSQRIADYIAIRLHDEPPLYILNVGQVSEEYTDGSYKHVLAVTDKNRMYKISIEALDIL